MTEEHFSEIATAHVLEHYKNHCRYLGYSIEESDEITIMCRHPRKESLQITQLEKCAGVSASLAMLLPKYAHHDLPLLFEFANFINSQFTFLKAHIIVEDNGFPPMVHLTSVCEGEYSQKIFSTFMDNFEHDLALYKYHPKTYELWEPEYR